VITEGVIYNDVLSHERYEKSVYDMTLDELKFAYNARLVEKGTYHPESCFQSLVDNEMILITQEIKSRRHG
jgi:hypothetical protein